MPDSIVTRRYARALYEEARQQDVLARVDDDVDTLRETLEGAPELARFFRSPVISPERKRAVVDSLFKERVHSLVLRFMHLLIAKQREVLFPEIVRTYRVLRDEEEGIVEAHAQVAYVFGEEEREALEKALKKVTGRNVRLRLTRSEGLLGGVVVRVGDTVYDGSVKHRLASLRERMESGVATASNGRA